MTNKVHLGECLHELALGTLGREEQARADEHLLGCPQCAADLRETRDALALLALELPTVAPPRHAIDDLLPSIQRSGRFDGFADKVAELYDVTPQRARELLRYLDDSARWYPGPGANTKMMGVQPGQAYSRHFGMFVRVDAGTVFPWHEHQGDEDFVVLEGSCIEPDGTIYRPGAVACNPMGTAHDFTASPDGPDFIFAVRIAGGIRFVSKPDK